MEKQIVTLETKDVLTDSHRQAVMRISKMLETMCSEFKAYQYKIVAGLESDEEVTCEQVVFDKHQKEAMEFIDHLGDLLVKPHPSDPSPPSTNIHSVDRHLNFMEDSVRTIQRAVETPDLVDTHVLTCYLHKISSVELQGSKKEIFSLNDV